MFWRLSHILTVHQIWVGVQRSNFLVWRKMWRTLYSYFWLRTRLQTSTSLQYNAGATFPYWLYRSRHLRARRKTSTSKTFLPTSSPIMEGLHLLHALPSRLILQFSMDCFHSRSAVKLLSFIISKTTNTQLSAEIFFITQDGRTSVFQSVCYIPNRSSCWDSCDVRL